MSLSEVSSALWRERELLDVLQPEPSGLRPAAGDQPRHAGQRAGALPDALPVALGMAELGRAVAVLSVTLSLGLEPGSSLRELASVAPAPWDRILREHRDALRAVTPGAAQPSLLEFLR